MVATLKFDNYNHYISTLRLLICDKLLLSNIFEYPILSSASAVIELKELADFDDSRLIAAVFILRLLTGGRPYISRFGLFQTFHTRAYDILVQVNVGKVLAYKFFAILAERVFPFIAKVDFAMTFFKKKNGIVVNMTISDLSFVRVVETHSVFFRWHDVIRVNFETNCRDKAQASKLLASLKGELK